MMTDCVHYPPCAEFAKKRWKKKCSRTCQFYCPGEDINVITMDDAIDTIGDPVEWLADRQVYKLNELVDEIAGGGER